MGMTKMTSEEIRKWSGLRVSAKFNQSVCDGLIAFTRKNGTRALAFYGKRHIAKSPKKVDEHEDFQTVGFCPAKELSEVVE